MISSSSMAYWTFSIHRKTMIKKKWRASRMVRLQLCFVSIFLTGAMGNQNNHERKEIVIFAEVEYSNLELEKYRNYIVEYADQHEDVYELYQMQNKTNSVISISERLEKKRYHQHTVEIDHHFSELGF